jgi:methyl-accepting chemotaxis protein
LGTGFRSDRLDAAPRAARKLTDRPDVGLGAQGTIAMFHPDFGGDAKRTLAALSRQIQVVEFAPDGTILSANDVYCAFLDRDPNSIVGKHHSVVVSREYAKSREYKEFLAKIARGESFAQEVKRVDKSGREKWVQAYYSPVVARGSLRKVVAVGVDVTAIKTQAVESAGKIDAISRAQAMIEFAVDGTVIAANENFLKTLGYALEEIQGKPHSMFLDPADAKSADYQDFWRRLNQGECIALESKRLGKNGKEVWIQASYNPIFDLDRRVVKIVKLGRDVSGRVVGVNCVAEGLSRLAEGDLRQRLDTPLSGKFEPLRLDFNRSVEALEKATTSIVASASSIQAGAGEISAAADDLSRRTEQQASSLEETAAALEEITATVKKTAEGAKHARDVVANARVDADKSGAVVREAMAAMTGIDKSSKQISQIIGVIDEIAFQTNLLALNAGVEAARAGDAGRGFAVVASEVRALAQRSAEAAKEIKGLISTSTAQVDEGVLLVTQTGQALERIVAQVGEINDVIVNIAASAGEQATGLQQVNTAVADMDQVTQKNAAMVEETTAASHALVGEAGELGKLMAHFHTRQGAEDPLRRELKKAVPHAFREPAKAAAKEEPARRPAAKAVARAAPAAAADDWKEF